MFRSIFIAAGHSDTDPGASGNGAKESTEAVEVARELAALCRRVPGVKVYTIGVDGGQTLAQKISTVGDIVSRDKLTVADSLLIDIHFNSASDPKARGVEGWYGKNGDSAVFAKTVLTMLATVSGLPARPKLVQSSDKNRHGRLGILDDTIPTAVLVECGFLTNKDDAALAKDPVRDDKLAEGIFKGICAYAVWEPEPVDPAGRAIMRISRAYNLIGKDNDSARHLLHEAAEILRGNM